MSERQNRRGVVGERSRFLHQSEFAPEMEIFKTLHRRVMPGHDCSAVIAG